MKTPQKKRTFGTFLLAALVYLAGAVLFGLYSNFQTQKQMLKEIDHRLLLAAKSLKYMLAPDFHDRTVDPDAISLEEERINRKQISDFAAETHFEYLYTLVLNGESFYFSAPTVTEEELKIRDRWYFYPYPDAPAEFFEALEQMEVKYATYEDQWGMFRSVALPQISPSGNKYLACADYDLSYLRALFWKNLFHSTITVIPLLLLTLPFIFIFRSQNRSHTEKLEEINRKLAARAEALSLSNSRLGREMADRQKAERALRISEHRLRQIVEMVPAGIVIIDAEMHIVVDANPAAFRIMESEKDAVIGSVCHSGICPAEAGACPITDLGQRVDNSERVVLTASGREKPVIKTVATIHLEGRRHLIESFIDISPLKKAESEKTALQKQLYQSQKMEAVGTLAGGIAHDFNNLLSIIIGYTEILLEEVAPDHPHFSLLDEIYGASIRAKDVTRQLLAFGRKQILEVKNIDVNHTITAFQKMLGRFIGEDILLDLALMPAPATVSADTSQLEQVLMNLAVNARDAMPDGGRLSIETALVELDQEYADIKPEVKPGAYIQIAVSDTGAGIDPEYLKNIFEPFFTTKKMGKGTGLGLSTVYGIIKQHGGNIWVYSEPRMGTTFKIYLPYRPETPIDARVSPDSTPDFLEPQTILVVEDDPAVQKLVCRILQEHGHTVLESSSAEHAIRIAESFSGPIDLLLTDVIMPGMNGPEVYRQVYAFHSETKVLYTSGYTGSVITRHGVLKEGISFIQKPFSRKGLLHKIAQTLQIQKDTSDEN